MRAIDIMIVGAQKAGTTSLKNYLGEHLDVCVHDQKEITMFIDGNEYSYGFEQNFDIYYRHYSNEKILLGKSVGIMYSKDALERLYKHNPNIKLVLILRNPVERAYSAYWYACRKGWEILPSFEEAINAGVERFNSDWLRRNNCDYINRGMYFKRLQEISSFFPRGNIYIYSFEALKENPEQICHDILSKVDATLTDVNIVINKKKYNSSSMPRFPFLLKIIQKLKAPKFIKKYRIFNSLKSIKRLLLSKNERSFSPPPMSQVTRDNLYIAYKDEIENLKSVYGVDTSAWL